jgi:hypothetical protein
VRCSCVGMMWKLMCFWYESLAVVSCHYTFQSSNEKVVQLTVSFCGYKALMPECSFVPTKARYGCPRKLSYKLWIQAPVVLMS